jgi:hypothetical protein
MKNAMLRPKYRETLIQNFTGSLSFATGKVAGKPPPGRTADTIPEVIPAIPNPRHIKPAKIKAAAI